MGIGNKLRQRRQELNLSRNQLAEKIHVTPSAIANYENGFSYPKPDILIALIHALEVDANYFYQDYLVQSKIRTLYGRELTSDEMETVAEYKMLTESSKRLARALIHEEFSRTHVSEWLEFPCIQPGVRMLHSGFLPNEATLKIRIKRKNVIEGTDYCFQIQVDRYQPVFRKNDILALQKKPARHNEIGIFCLNDVYYIRSLYHVGNLRRLRALNVMEPDIEVLSSDDFVCIGRILGKVYGTCELIDLSKNKMTRFQSTPQ